MSSLYEAFVTKSGLLYYHQRVRDIISKQTRFQLPSISGEGNVTVLDSAYGYLLDLTIEGKSTQLTTPSLDSVVDIRSVADNGMMIITNYTNMYDPESPMYISGLTCNDVNCNFETSQSINHRLYYVPCRPNTTYTLTKRVGTYCRFVSCQDKPTSNGEITIFNIDTSLSLCTITTGPFDYYLAFEPLTTEEIDTIGYDAVEESIEIKAIETVTITLDESLKSSADVHDSIRLLDGTYGVFRRLQKHVFVGDTEEGWVSTGVAGQYKIAIPNGKNFAMPMCTHAVGKEFATSIVGQCYYTNGEFIINTTYIGMNEFLNALATNNMTVFTVLAEPVFKPLEQDIQVQLFSLTSFDNNTTLFVGDALLPTITFTYPKSDVAGLISFINNQLATKVDTSTADNVTYDNSESGINAKTVQEAIDEIVAGGLGVELTQAEYDALPDSKYSDNITYYITDGGAAGDASNVQYDPNVTGLEVNNVQSVLDYVVTKINDIEARAVFHTTT